MDIHPTSDMKSEETSSCTLSTSSTRSSPHQYFPKAILHGEGVVFLSLISFTLTHPHPNSGGWVIRFPPSSLGPTRV